MNDRLFINGIECDLNPNTVIAITYQINDVGTLEDRQANYTNQFKIPRTLLNRTIFEQCDVPHVQTTFPYKKLSAKVFKEGLEVISDGYAIVESSGSEFAVTVYGGLIDFFKLIEGKKLQDLNLNNYNHLWDLNSMAGSLYNSNGYIYGLIDNGTGNDCTNPTNVNIQADHVAPCFFIHTIVSEIIQQAGYSLEGEPLDDEFYKKTLIQLGCNGLNASGLVLRAELTQDNNSHSNQGGLTSVIVANDDFSGSAVTQVGNFDTLSSYNTTSGMWTMPQDAQAPTEFQLKWEFDVEFRFQGGLQTRLVAGIEVNGTLIYTRRLAVVQPNTTFTTTVFLELPNGDYNQSDNIRALVFTQFPDPNTLQWSMTIKSGAKIQATFYSAVQLQYGGAINISQNLPEWTQIDFLKAVSQMFGLMWKPNYPTKTMYVGSMKVIEDRMVNAIDWSNKLHIVEDANGEQVVDMKFRLGNYGMANRFSYSNDEQVTENLGTGYIGIDNETLDPLVDVIVLPFSASDTALVTGAQVLLTKIPMWTTPVAPATTYETIEVTPRVLYLDRKTQFPDVFELTDQNNSYTVNSVWNFLWFINYENPQNLGFDNSLLRDYYNSYKRIFNRIQVITAQFKLSSVDIQNLDHFTPVYISQFGNYYYVNKVMNYVGSDKLTKVELIKLGEVEDVEVVTVFSEVIKNGLFNQAISDEGNPGLKYWNTPYREWNNVSPITQLQNGCYYDYQNGNQQPLEQTFDNALDNSGTYQIKFTINEFTNGAFDLNILDANNNIQFQINQSIVGTIPSGVEYVDQFTCGGSDWNKIQFAPDAIFDGGIYNVSLKRIA